jgi:hypothetical protein
MNWGGPGFVIAIIMVCTVGWIINNWIRARHGYPLENDWGGTSEKSDNSASRKIDLLTTENEQLVGKIDRLQERIAVLERIATDANSSSNSLANEIEQLRAEKDRA